MKFVNVREFKTHATEYLRSPEELVITRYGRPIARVVPESVSSISEHLSAMGRILKDAGVTPREALEAVKRARKRVYGSPRQGRYRR